MSIILRVLIVCLMSSMCVVAQTNAFLYDSLKGVSGVRAIGMGRAYIGVAEESSSLFANPAGLSVPGVVLNYELLDFNRSQLSLNEVFSLYLSPIGYGYSRRKDTEGQFSRIGYYGFSKRGVNGVDWGVTYKTVEASLGNGAVSSWSSDFGLLFRLTPNLNWGVVGYDVLKKNIEVKTTLSTGFSWFNKDRSIIFATDWIHYHFNDSQYVYGSAGLDLELTRGLRVRLGSNRETVSLGASINFPFLDLEYALQKRIGSGNDMVYYVGFKLGKGINTYSDRRRYSWFKRGGFAEFSIGGNLSVGRSTVSFFNGQKIGTNDLLMMLDEAERDESCKGLIIRVQGLSNSLSTIAVVQEFRDAIKRFKQSKKKVYVYLDGSASLPDLYLASMADHIMMPELGTIGQLGLDFEVVKTKTLFNNFGIGFDVLTTGKHKGALNPNSKDMSAHDRDLVENLVHELYQQVLIAIKEDRQLDWVVVSDAFDGSFLSAKKGKEMGLIDSLGFWSDLKNNVAQWNADVPNFRLSVFGSDSDYGFVFPYFNRIAIIELDGVINQGESRPDYLFGVKATGSDDVQFIVDKIIKDPTIRGVVMRVNSPGGSIVASDQIYHAVKELRENNKLVYTSMGNVAASGGYYVALASDQIWANSGTLTGSIGVISVFQNFERFNNILGIKRDVIKTGPYMDMLSSNHALTDKEKDMFLAFQKEKYNIFVDRVKENRYLTDQEVQDIAQGQVFTGEQASQLKLIDHLGSFHEVLGAMSKELGIRNPEYVMYRFPSMLGRFFPGDISI